MLRRLRELEVGSDLFFKGTCVLHSLLKEDLQWVPIVINQEDGDFYYYAILPKDIVALIEDQRRLEG